jgi:hypothetical protein
MEKLKSRRLFPRVRGAASNSAHSLHKAGSSKSGRDSTLPPNVNVIEERRKKITARGDQLAKLKAWE